MWIKILGILLTVTACGGLGADAAFRVKRRLRLLEELKTMATHLKGEILYANAPLDEAFERTGRRNPGSAGTLFSQVADEMREETGESFGKIWAGQAQAFAKTSLLSQKEKEELIRFGEHLGYLDRDMQEKTIQFYLEDLEHAIQALRKQEPEKCRLFMSLGVLSGLFLAVVMV